MVQEVVAAAEIALIDERLEIELDIGIGGAKGDPDRGQTLAVIHHDRAAERDGLLDVLVGNVASDQDWLLG